MFENGALRGNLDRIGWKQLEAGECCIGRDELHNFTVIDSQNACGSIVPVEWVPDPIQEVKSSIGDGLFD
jgi:hypothetical protein